MATKTPNFDLTKPDKLDFYDVDEYNDNWEKIDTALGTHKEAIKKIDDIDADVSEAIDDINEDIKNIKKANTGSIKSTKSGTSLNITDSANAAIKGMVVTPTDVSITSVNVTTCGKNLLKFEGTRNATSNGISVTSLGDGGYTYKGTATDQYVNNWFLGGYKSKTVLFTLPVGTYTSSNILMFTETGASIEGLGVKKLYPNETITFTLTEPKNITGINAPHAVIGQTYDLALYPYVVRGSKAGYEQYKEQTATIDTTTQTGWETLETYYPVTNIISGVDANIECTYVADTKLYVDERASNRNLLDNWCFVNPINQRGQTTYTGTTGYTIDRWMFNGGTGESNTLTIMDDCISLNRTGSQCGLAQFIEYKFKAGTKLTLSVLYKGSITIDYWGWGSSEVYTSADWGIATLTYTVTTDTDMSTRSYCPTIRGGKLNEAVYIKAVKLEVGEVSTLLADAPPNRAEELMKCQRYYNKVAATYTTGKTRASDDTTADVFVPLPVTMRENATISVVGTVPQLTCGFNTTKKKSTAITQCNQRSNGVLLVCTIPAGIGTDNFINCLVPSYLELSADL